MSSPREREKRDRRDRRGDEREEQESGVILELSDREKFCDNFRISGRSFGQNFGFPYTFYTFSLLSQLKIGKSQQA